MEKEKVNVVRDRNNANTGRTPGTNYPMESERDFQKRTQFYKYRARARMMEQDANIRLMPRFQR